MTLKADYIGQKDGNSYCVNVKTANPTGKIGDAGVIRCFDSEEKAKTYAKSVNDTGVDCFVKSEEKPSEQPVRHEGDVFESSKK